MQEKHKKRTQLGSNMLLVGIGMLIFVHDAGVVAQNEKPVRSMKAPYSLYSEAPDQRPAGHCFRHETLLIPIAFFAVERSRARRRQEYFSLLLGARPLRNQIFTKHRVSQSREYLDIYAKPPRYRSDIPKKRNPVFRELLQTRIWEFREFVLFIYVLNSRNFSRNNTQILPIPV